MNDEWVVVREHLMNPSLLSMDGGAVALLSLEAELAACEIEAAFDPYRPGEGAGWSRSLEQPFRLLVKVADLPRAEEIARALESEPLPDLELDEGFEDFGDPVE